jgi:hypothetical protein
MKTTFDSVLADDRAFLDYLNSLTIDKLEKKLCIAEDNIADVREELQDLVAFKNTIKQVLKEKRDRK